MDWDRDFRAARGNGEPVGRRLRGRHSLRGQQDQSTVVQVDGVAIMIGGWFVGRCSDRVICGRLAVMAMAMGVTITEQMEMLPIRMPRSLGMDLVRVLHRNSAEKQLGGHEHDEEQSHDPSSLVWPPGSGNVGRHSSNRVARR